MLHRGDWCFRAANELALKKHTRGEEHARKHDEEKPRGFDKVEEEQSASGEREVAQEA